MQTKLNNLALVNMRRRDLQRELKDQEKRKLKQRLFPIAVISFSLLAVYYFLVTFGYLETPQLNISDSLDQQQQNPPSNFCMDLVSKCEILIERSEVPCGIEAIKQKISAEMSLPLESESCKNAITEMEQLCPEECKLDLSSITFVPGAIDFTFEEIAEGCRAKAKKSVNLRGICR